jgi:predicted nucleic acid-binding protein
MTQSKNSDEIYSEQRRQRAAELIAALVRKRRRVSTDESLLDQAALRDGTDRATRNERDSVD